MIRRLRLCRSPSTDPYYNLALEQRLMETVEDDCCILYLWRNENTVVIGRNQNAWKECRVSLLESEGGRLARRLSGGGAVFHDLGNLNFTFLVSAANYDLDRQLGVISAACRGLGVRAERSGRNDILAGGRKLSGNAFYKAGGRACHHGTLLVDADIEKMTRYLAPSGAKLAARSVDSVRSRVVNLKELAPGLSVPLLEERLCIAFQEAYALPCSALDPEELRGGALQELLRRNQSREWNLGLRAKFGFSLEGRFPWGGIEIGLSVEGGVISGAKVWSDAMDWRLASRLEETLIGCPFTREALAQRIERSGLDERRDIAGLFNGHI